MRDGQSGFGMLSDFTLLGGKKKARHRSQRQRGEETRLACPPVLTGGESSKIDWLTVTFLPMGGDIAFSIIDFLRSVFSRPVCGESGKGMFGYESSVSFSVMLDDGKKHHVGRLDYGGSHHACRARLDISGSGCNQIKSWEIVHQYISQLTAMKITRVDVACDFLNGEFTVDDAVEWYKLGLFHAGGRRPRHNMVGDWLNPTYGRTFEVGRRENGKMLRVYEKGKQLGDASSNWTRFEVEIRNNDREIPPDILVNCDTYFAGAYSCLSQIIDATATRIATEQKSGEISLEKLKHHAKQSYGRLINVLGLFLNHEEIFEQLSKPGVPARLEKASLSGFLSKGSCSPALIKEF